MVLELHLSYLQNCIKETNKIPEYAREYKKEYLFITGINEELQYFVDNIDDATRGLFENKKVDRIKYFIERFLKGQERGKLRDISRLFFWKYDILNFIEFYENITFDILDIKYADDFYDLFCKLYSKINYKYYDSDGNVKVKECVINILDSDGIDSDEIDSLLISDSDSDSDSDGIDSDEIDSLLISDSDSDELDSDEIDSILNIEDSD